MNPACAHSQKVHLSVSGATGKSAIFSYRCRDFVLGAAGKLSPALPTGHTAQHSPQTARLMGSFDITAS